MTMTMMKIKIMMMVMEMCMIKMMMMKVTNKGIDDGGVGMVNQSSILQCGLMKYDNEDYDNGYSQRWHS